MPALQDIRVDHVSYSYDGRLPVLNDVDASFAAGRITAIIGGNGSGKSTLLHTMARLLTPREGAVIIDRGNIHSLAPRIAAQSVGILLQEPETMDDLTVYDVVVQGRYPYRRFLKGLLPEDQSAVHAALRRVQLLDLSSRKLHTLSGGQKQRVWIALLLAQDSDYLLLDEPTTFLDLAHQIETLDIVSRLNRERGKTVVMVLHDINQAIMYADHLVVMKEGHILRTGTPEEIVDSHLIQEAFGVSCQVVCHPQGGCKYCVPLRARR